MAAGLSGAAMTSFAAKNPLLAAASRRSVTTLGGRAVLFSPLTSRTPRRRGLETVTCFVPQDTERPTAPVPVPVPTPALEEEARATAARRIAERKEQKQSERRTYLVAAVMSSLGVTSMAVAAVYYRFSWQMEGGEVPVTEMLGTFALSVGAAVGMEFWARWAHRALWHASLWNMHESHHRPREGPFELNDVFAIINAVPAICLLAYGFFHRGLVPGLCFGAGLGITLFGMAYMFVHDGLVHRRFPVGPIANVPYFRRVAAAHKIHHMDKYESVPYGLFLGPKELEEVGGLEELEKELARISRSI
ncbi:beta-carotene hydroxylase 2, chloroplastic-like [Phragmites australis]|uniref:beta-carotene hydroxylase 2, chloroplastic-like n=1 Tax=Phragmites australis TaxID=29695 RepID=UPI002D77D506|nr:beta-carotene hydroxylase 2, chloroplastic-like [Phragmites australis]